MYCPQGLLLLMSIFYCSSSAPDLLLLSLKYKQLFEAAWWWAVGWQSFPVPAGVVSFAWCWRWLESCHPWVLFSLAGVWGLEVATWRSGDTGQYQSPCIHAVRFQPLMLCCWFYVLMSVRVLLQLGWDCQALKCHGPHVHVCLCSPRQWEALPLPGITQDHYSGLQPCAGLVSTLRSGTSTYVRSCHVSWPMCIPYHVPTS